MRRRKKSDRESQTIDARCLNQQLAALEVKDRWWEILSARVNERLTLEEVGYRFGFTKQRARQITFSTINRIGKGIEYLRPALDELETKSHLLWRPFDDKMNIELAAQMLQDLLTESGWSHPSVTDAKRLATSLRALAHGEKSLGQRLWPNLSFALCSLPPPIVQHEKVARSIERQHHKERKWTYEELITAVLKSANTPLHSREIAERAEKLGRRPNFNVRSFYGELYRNKEKFALVSQGTYGLVAWGLSSVDA